MTQLANVLPPSYESFPDQMRRERLDRAAADKARGEAWSSALADSVSEHWITSTIGRQWNRSGFAPDPNFDPFANDEFIFKQLTHGLDPSLWPMFADAVSMPHALKIREQATDMQLRRQRLSQLGWSGAALQMGTSLLDPGFLPVMLMPVGGEAAVAGKEIGRAHV